MHYGHMERTGSGIDQIDQRPSASDAESLLSFTCKGIPKEQLMLPGPDHVDRAWALLRPQAAGAGEPAAPLRHRPARRHRLSVDPAGRPGGRALGRRLVRAQPDLLRPREHRRAGDRGASATPSPRPSASSASVARKYAHKIPFIAKINHNELLTYPNKFQQILFGNVEQAWDMGAAAVGATIYFGSEDADREIVEIAEAFHHAHELGLATVLWAYTAQQRLQEGRRGLPHRRRPDRPGQPPRRHHAGRHRQAEAGDGERRLHRRSTSARPAPRSTASWWPTTRSTGTAGRWSTATWAAPSLINSGGESKGADDFAQAVRTAVINKRAGGAGLISGRKAFQRPMKEGVELFHAIQDVFLCDEVTVA